MTAVPEPRDAWRARLDLTYSLENNARTVARSAHEGPLRVLKSLYPEGAKVCHHVVVHPPGGIVGGDVLDIGIDVAAGAHAVLTTPGATRFYRSRGAPGAQQVRARLGVGARLEWLPLETLLHDGAHARNSLRVHADASASMIGWDLVGLGLPAAGQSLRQGRLELAVDIEGLWLERALVDAQDVRLMQSPLGLADYPVFGTAWLLLAREHGTGAQAEALDAARAVVESAEGVAADDAAVRAGVTCLGTRLVVARALASRVEPMMRLMRRWRAVWRRAAWQLDGVEPRIWST